MFLKRSIICPFCFEEIQISQILYACSNKKCIEGNRPYIIPEVFQNKVRVDKYGATIYVSGQRNSPVICNKCEQQTTTRACPKCKRRLPDNPETVDTNILAIAGAPSSGKSYYVATNIRQIMDKGLLAQFGISPLFVRDEDRSEYINRYKNNIEAKIEFRPTEVANNDLIEENPPILIELTAGNSTKREVYSFFEATKREVYSFFDAAGESFDNEAIAKAVTPYFNNAKAIVLILDPLQIETVRNAVQINSGNGSQTSSMTFLDLINNVVHILRNYQRKEKQFSIPLCIAISKWDLVVNTPDLLPPGLSVGKQIQRMSGTFDDNYIENTSEEIRSLLYNWEPSLVAAADNNFKTVRYFCFSAWGFEKIQNGEMPENIASYRVEDPLLWIMRKNKFI